MTETSANTNVSTSTAAWRTPVSGWIIVAAILSALAAVLVANRHRFDWALDLGEIPARPLMAGLMLAGVAFLLLRPLLRRTTASPQPYRRALLVFVLAIGALLRLAMFATEPALEDDQQRYLFEGAMVANGVSPYRVSPKDALSADRTSKLGQLAEASKPVIDRVNHPALKTIYPPVAQAAFAVAYKISPFNIQAWRALLFVAECGSVALLLYLLTAIGRDPLWIALYWWNPIAIKELANSGHMEGVLMFFVVLAAYCAARRRHLWSAVALGLAVGVKIWPLLLAPVLFRSLTGEGQRRTAALTLLILGALTALWAWIVLSPGLDANSGFVAYAERWQANGALLPALRDSLKAMSAALGLPLEALTAGRTARLLLATAAATFALVAAWRPIADTADLLQRCAAITLALVLLSPAQFPWYALWTLPFLVFRPRWSVMLMAVTLPIYYSSFYFSAIGTFEVFRDRVVWLVWLPVWAALAYEWWTGEPSRKSEQYAT